MTSFCDLLVAFFLGFIKNFLCILVSCEKSGKLLKKTRKSDRESSFLLVCTKANDSTWKVMRHHSKNRQNFFFRSFFVRCKMTTSLLSLLTLFLHCVSGVELIFQKKKLIYLFENRRCLFFFLQNTTKSSSVCIIFGSLLSNFDVVTKYQLLSDFCRKLFFSVIA